jgi:hypothetical protein
MYDGYSWDGKTKLLNPWSLLNFFMDKQFNFYWYASGSPRFLMELIKKKPASYTSIKNYKITENILDAVDIANIHIESLLFQTGYLTVKEVPPSISASTYILDIPNHEVKEVFDLQILSTLTNNIKVMTGQMPSEIIDALKAGDLQAMLSVLRRLFASIPYQLHVDLEAYYHSVFYAVMSVLGFDISAEVSTSKGRIDAVLELSDKVYVIEFKYIKCPEGATSEAKAVLFEKALDAAMEQIMTRGYDTKYKKSTKKIYKAAFAFLGRDEIEMRI